MVKEIHINQDILLSNGLNHFIVSSTRDLNLTFYGNCESQVYLQIDQAQNIQIRTFTENATVKYLIWNNSNEELHIQESHTVLKDATLHIAYGEVNPAVTQRKSVIELRQEGASAFISSASLVSSKKIFDIDAINYAKHTSCIMENYSVVLEGGNYQMNCVGKIVNGASGSLSKQTSRALCFDDKQSSTIIPQLIIDENDVQASHATSVGRVNEDQLYYMQLRGLDQKECTRLISTGYLLPITNVLDDETLNQTLKEALERKIAESCSK